MRNYIIKATIIFSVVYLSIIAIIFLLFFWYNNRFAKDYANDLGYQQHETYYNQINNQLGLDYETFEIYVDKYQNVSDINLNKEQVDKSYLSYFAFYEISNEGITINNQLYQFKNENVFNRDYNLNVSFYSLENVVDGYIGNELFGVFRKDNIIGLYDSKLYMNQFMSDINYDVSIMRNNGFMLYANNPISTNLLFDYIDETTTNYFNEYFSKRLSSSSWVKINKENYLMSFSPLDINNELYFITFTKQDLLLLSFESLNIYLLTALLFISITFVIFNAVIFYLSLAKFNDIENARLKVYLNKRLLIRVNKKGKIVLLSKGFKQTIINHKKLKNIKDITSSDDTTELSIIERIKKGFTFNANLETNDGLVYIKFIPLRLGIQYLLVGDNLNKDDYLFKEYETLALTNKITKLPNYNAYEKTMEEVINKLEDNKKVYVMGLNILDFRSMNKLIGEKVANKVLIELTEVIKKSLSDHDVEIFNTYVDNFLVIFKSHKKLEEVESYIENLYALVESSTNFSDNNLHLELRAGIYEVIKNNNQVITSKSVFDNVMIALKHSNQSLTSKYSVYDMTLKELVSQRQRLELALIESIQKKEFQMYLQPQYDILLNKIVSFEALIRWTNPKFSHIGPNEFIRLAEENNLIIQIGEIVMDETAKIAKLLEKYKVTISMNISPVQMIQKGFVHQFEEVLEKYQLAPHALAVEVTETFMVTSLQLMSEKLKLIQKLGIDIHLDDFGMGYSSLAYLKELPIDMIKIDKEFINYITTDKYSKAIVNMIVNLSKNIGVGIIAEGVETEQQSNQLSKLGVTIIQGWLISKAVKLEDAINLLEKYNNKSKS